MSRFLIMATLVYSLNFGAIFDCGGEDKKPAPGPSQPPVTGVAEAKLTVATGAVTPTAQSWTPGATGVRVLAFSLTAGTPTSPTQGASPEPVTLKAVRVRVPLASGTLLITGDHVNNLATTNPVKLYQADSSGNPTGSVLAQGQFDTAQGTANLALTPTLALAQGTPRQFVVTFDFSATATGTSAGTSNTDNKFGAQLAVPSGIDAEGATSNKPLTDFGTSPTLQGALQTLIDPATASVLLQNWTTTNTPPTSVGTTQPDSFVAHFTIQAVAADATIDFVRSVHTPAATNGVLIGKINGAVLKAGTSSDPAAQATTQVASAPTATGGNTWVFDLTVQNNSLRNIPANQTMHFFVYYNVVAATVGEKFSVVTASADLTVVGPTIKQGSSTGPTIEVMQPGVTLTGATTQPNTTGVTLAPGDPEQAVLVFDASSPTATTVSTLDFQVASPNGGTLNTLSVAVYSSTAGSTAIGTGTFSSSGTLSLTLNRQLQAGVPETWTVKGSFATGTNPGAQGAIFQNFTVDKIDIGAGKVAPTWNGSVPTSGKIVVGQFTPPTSTFVVTVETNVEKLDYSVRSPDLSDLPAILVKLTAPTNQNVTVDEIRITSNLGSPATPPGASSPVLGNLLLDDGTLTQITRNGQQVSVRSVDTANDQALVSAKVAFQIVSGDHKVVFDLGGLVIAQGQTEYWWVTYDIPSSTTNGTKFDAELTTASDLTATVSPTLTPPAGQSALKGTQITVGLSTLTVREGTENPTDATVIAISSIEVPVLQFNLAVDTLEDVQVQQVVIKASGSGADQNEILTATLYEDKGTKGVKDIADLQLARVSDPYGATDDGEVTFSFNSSILKSANKDYLVTYNFANGIAGSSTFRAALVDLSKINAVGFPSSLATQQGGNPVDGGLMTIGVGTLTVDVGTNPPTGGAVSANDTDVAMLYLRLTATVEPISIYSMAFRAGGTGADDTEIADVNFFKEDSTQPGAQAGVKDTTDQALGQSSSTTHTFSANNGEVTFGAAKGQAGVLGITVTPGTPLDLLLTYNFAASIAAGGTFTLSIEDAKIAAEGVSSAQTIAATAATGRTFPITGATKANSAGILTLARHQNSLSDGFVYATKQNLAILTLTATAAIENITVNSVRINTTVGGTFSDANDEDDIKDAALYLDDPNNGTQGSFDPGTDTLLGAAAAQSFSADNGSLTFTLTGVTITQGQSQTWFVVFNLGKAGPPATAAENEDTFHVAVDQMSAQGTSGNPPSIGGLPVSSSVLTVKQPEIEHLFPGHSWVGTFVTVEGKNLDSTASTPTIGVFIGSAQVPSADVHSFVTQGKTWIMFKIPSGTVTDKVKVQVDGIDSPDATNPTLTIKNRAAVQSSGVVINEVVTDPQQDWNDSAGGDGTRFNAVPGTGSPTDSDEWIELYNNNAGMVDLTGWKVVTYNGPLSDITEIETGNGDQQFSTDITLNPDEYAVIGNPLGKMNNDVYIQLLKRTGTNPDYTWEIVDDVELGAGTVLNDPNWGQADDGDASGILDEAVARIPNGEDTDDNLADWSSTTTAEKRNATILAHNERPVITGIVQKKAAPLETILIEGLNFPISSANITGAAVTIDGQDAAKVLFYSSSRIVATLPGTGLNVGTGTVVVKNASGASNGGPKIEILTARPATTANTVLINEIVTNPQRDWDDSSGANGIPFDDTPGAGAASDPEDEWIELVNVDTVDHDLKGWKLVIMNQNHVFVNVIGETGFDNTGSFLGPVRYIKSTGGTSPTFTAITNQTEFSLPPSEFLVVGDPDGMVHGTLATLESKLNGEVFIQLVNANGEIVDDIELGGNDLAGDGGSDGPNGGVSSAKGVAGEPVYREVDASGDPVDANTDSGDWKQSGTGDPDRPATPGKPNG